LSNHEDISDGPEGDVSPRKFEKLRKLANADFSRFAVAVQHVSAEVQMKLIEQLPEFRKLATEALEANDQAFQAILKSNDEGEEALREAHKKWRDVLAGLLANPDLSLEQQLLITAEIGKSIELESKKDSENKAFKMSMFNKVGLLTVGVVGVIVLGLAGGKLMLDGDAPEL
jgi:cellobiose-specific phosphotransferase system component IIA